MLSKRIRRRLRDLDHGPPTPTEPRESAPDQSALLDSPAPVPPEAVTPEPTPRDLDEQLAYAQAQAAFRPPPPPPPGGSLDELAPGEVLQTEHGNVYSITARPADILPGADAILQGLRELTSTEPLAEDDRLNCLRNLSVSDLVLLDTETAGLSMAPIFEIGLLLWPSDDVADATIVQLMARDYSEERALLAETARLIGPRRVLMTYNGRSFDVPMMRERTIYHGLPALPETEEHLDLLLVTRSLFKGRWENCRLQTLEKRLCGRERWGDIEGAEIPQAYHDFVQDTNAGRMKLVLEHNRLDLITMLEVLPWMADPQKIDERG